MSSDRLALAELDGPGMETVIVTGADMQGGYSASAFTAAAFGKDAAEHYRAVAEFGWDAFMRIVTDWERERYLDAI